MMVSGLPYGGAERNIVYVAPHIAAGVDLRLVTMNTRRDGPLAEEFAASGVPRFDLGAKRMTDLNAWRRFSAMLQDEKIDVIHAQDQDTIVYAALARRRLGIPTVMTRHVEVEPTDTVKERVRAQMVLISAKFGIDHVVAVSKAVRESFSDLAGVPLERIDAIYNGIPVERFQVATPKPELRARLGWKPDAPTIIVVAVLRRGKGHEILFEAMPQVIQQLPHVQVKVVGEGEIADKVRAWAAPLGDAVEFMGQRADVPDLLAASDVVVLPSWSEALPNVLIEAGAAGRPAVTTDVGGAKEVTLDGETGYVVPPGDRDKLAARIVDVLCNPEASAAMGERASEWVRGTFSLSQQATQYIDLYRRVCKS